MQTILLIKRDNQMGTAYRITYSRMPQYGFEIILKFKIGSKILLQITVIMSYILEF